MSGKSNIEWTDATWNPVTGCSKVSAGCKHCYAEREWPRLAANPKTRYFGRKFTDVRCHPETLWSNSPGTWKRPRMVFVNSMSDLFHESVPFEFIDEVFEVINCSPMHTFQILTKRPARALEYFTRPDAWQGELDNFWLGVSIEDQKTADERIPLLMQTPVVVRWISAEPLLGAVDLKFHLGLAENHEDLRGNLHWVVVGGESGPKARPMHPDWVRTLRDQCAAAGVPFLFKQWGEFLPVTSADTADGITFWPDDGGPTGRLEGLHATAIEACGGEFALVGKKAAGRLLDGALHDAYPVVGATA